MPANTILIITSEKSTPSTVMRGILGEVFKVEVVGTLPENPPRLQPGEKPLAHALGDRLRDLLSDPLVRCCAIVLESAQLSPGPTIYRLAQHFAPLRHPIIAIVRPSSEFERKKSRAIVVNTLHPDKMLRAALESRQRDKHFVPNAAEANAVLRAMISDGTIPRPA